MINDSHKNLLWKVVSDSLFGFPAGSLVCVGYRSGGGFSGAPQELTLAPLAHVLPTHRRLELKMVEFPQPGPDVEYHVGGRGFSVNHYPPDTGVD